MAFYGLLCFTLIPDLAGTLPAFSKLSNIEQKVTLHQMENIQTTKTWAKKIALNQKDRTYQIELKKSIT